MDANAKTNHMLLSPENRKKQEAMAKNNYRDVITQPRRRNLVNNIEVAIQRESVEEDIISEVETEVQEQTESPS